MKFIFHYRPNTQSTNVARGIHILPEAMVDALSIFQQAEFKFEKIPFRFAVFEEEKN